MYELILSLLSLLFPPTSAPEASSTDGSSKDAAYFDVELEVEQ